MAERPQGSFDGIFLLDVLEHIEDDRTFLGDLVDRSLSDSGWVLMSVPAYQSVFTRHDEFLRHYRRYSPKQARRLLQSAGLSIEIEGGLFHSLLPLRFAQSVKERLVAPRREPEGLGGWNKGPTATRMVTAALDAEAKLSLDVAAKANVVVPGLSYWAFCGRAAARPS